MILRFSTITWGKKFSAAMTQTHISEAETERSPLIPKANDRREDGEVEGAIERHLNHNTTWNETNEDGAVSIKEPTTRELAVIMGALYISVFFAALGSSTAV